MSEVRPQDRRETGRSSYRKTIITLAVLVTAGLLSDLSIGVAAAAPEPKPQVALFWVMKGGVAIPPSNSIEILANETNQGDQPGVEIVLEVWVIPPPNGVHMFGFSLRWDEDGRNELEFVRADEQFRNAVGDLNWDPLALRGHISSKPSSAGDRDKSYGELGSYVACHKVETEGLAIQCEPESSDTPLTKVLKVVRLTFRANSTASPDSNDIRAIFTPNPGEWWVENEQGEPEEICLSAGCSESVVFGSASVVPEPGGLGMQLAALTTLGGLLSARRRR